MAAVVSNNSFWTNFADQSLYKQVDCGSSDKSVANQVLETFGISYSGDIGGKLSNIDIFHMDAMQAIKMSLIEASAIDIKAPYEPVIDPDDGSVTFKSVGTYSGSITDVYTTIATTSYVEDCSGVLVTGRKPLIAWKDSDWSNVFGDNNEYAYISDVTEMRTNCNKDNFSKIAVIAFKDPNIQTAFNDGIDNLYEITNSNPWDQIMGYAVQRNSKSNFMTDEVEIIDTQQSSIPLMISTIDNPVDLGTLIRRIPVPGDDIDDNPDCWSAFDASNYTPTDGMRVEIPSIFRYETYHGDIRDHYIGISQVFVLGMELSSCYGRAKDEESQLEVSTSDNTIVSVSINDGEDKMIVLREGIDYVVAYDDSTTPKIPYIVFGNGAKDYDNANYGLGTTYYIDPMCSFATDTGLIGNDLIKSGTILPLNGNTGVLVKQVWIMVDLAIPSIVITDPGGNAKDIADNFEYFLKPLVFVDEPAPIAFNGTLLDQAAAKQDHDPTTTQDFSDTDYERAMDVMDNGGGGLSINLSFLDGDGAKNLSSQLHTFMNNGNGIETVYSCGPNCDPQIGGYGLSNGVINSITYQYSDSSSYTISVTEGGRLIGGFSDVTGGPINKRAEGHSEVGTVIECLGNGIHFKVRLDGFGERVAINTSADVIRTGDRVNCTIYNNPIES